MNKEPQPHNLIDHPAHYTSHSSGVECIEIVEWFPANLANAWKYLHRQDLKGATLQDLQKARWYVLREIRRQRILARRHQSPAPYHPVTLPRLVARYLRHEDGQRRDVFGYLWNAFRGRDTLQNLRSAEVHICGLIYSTKRNQKGGTQ